MANEFDEYEEIEAAEDTAWKPEHDFTIFAEEAESSDAIPFDEDLGAALGAVLGAKVTGTNNSGPVPKSQQSRREEGGI